MDIITIKDTNPEKKYALDNIKYKNRFDCRDLNKDEKITLDELIEFYKNDEDLNKVLSADELEELAKYYFAKLDKNSDGYILFNELKNI